MIIAALCVVAIRPGVGAPGDATAVFPEVARLVIRRPPPHPKSSMCHECSLWKVLPTGLSCTSVFARQVDESSLV